MTLEEEVEELKQSPEHTLSPFENRIRRLLVHVYELFQDMKVENRDMHNRIEGLSSEILMIVGKPAPSVKVKNKV